MYSPFKESSLSPFKLLSQSPSKEAYDDWDKDLFSCLDENLFGMGGLTDNVVDELLKSPQGKALLEDKNSPLRHVGNSYMARQLRISPENNKQRGRHFQSLNDQSSDIFTVPSTAVKNEPFPYVEMKEENTLEDHMYGQQTHMFGNSLSAVDPNKMSATPVKPGFTNIENVPKRKLSMRSGRSTTGDIGLSEIGAQDENVLSIPATVQVQQTWPSKERLKFARRQFQEILNAAVSKEIKIIQEERRKKASVNSEKQNEVPAVSVIKTRGGKGKETKGKTKKTKTYRKKKKDTYPQIKMALSKPSVKGRNAPVIHKNLFSVPVPDFKDDPGWYPSDDEEDQTWVGPPPFYGQMELYSDDESSDYDEPATFKYETISGRRVTLKRPRLH